jgi:hypothetical protein
MLRLTVPPVRSSDFKAHTLKVIYNNLRH